jgi:hypothetical protein
MGKGRRDQALPGRKIIPSSTSPRQIGGPPSRHPAPDGRNVTDAVTV